jgi:hypothetical protein
MQSTIPFDKGDIVAQLLILVTNEFSAFKLSLFSPEILKNTCNRMAIPRLFQNFSQKNQIA